MCGIAGSFRTPRLTLDPTSEMLSELIHRGPDTQSIYRASWFSLGAARLAITDPAAGHQPYINEDLGVAVVFNGEIYNYKELWKPFERQNSHSVSKQSDTHLIPFLFREHGIRFIEQLDGMFAIALIDLKVRQLYLIRDRFGEKPLYFRTDARTGLVLFASEISALLSASPESSERDLRCLAGFLAHKHVPRPMTGWQDVQELAPATFVSFSVESPKSLAKRYWRPTRTPSMSISESDGDTLDRFEELLVASIRERIPADLPCAFALSGGLDSGVLAVLAREYGLVENLHTYTLVYNELEGNSGKSDDKEFASSIASQISSEHHEVLLSPSSYVQNFQVIAKAFSQPFLGTSSLWFLAKEVAYRFKVMLSGDGADELLGSYLTHRLAAQNELSDKPVNEVGSWIRETRLFSKKEVVDLLGRRLSDVESRYEEAIDEIENRFLRYRGGRGDLSAMLLAEMETVFPDQVLKYVDRLSMSHSLEIRAPYLDHQLADFMMSLPIKFRVRDGRYKWILRELALKYLPERMVERRKEGFVLPLFQWKEQVLVPLVNEYVTEERVQQDEVLNWSAVKTILEPLKERDKLSHREANKILAVATVQAWVSN